MRILRHLQYWLTGTGRPLRVADFVPESHPVRQWADTFPGRHRSWTSPRSDAGVVGLGITQARTALFR